MTPPLQPAPYLADPSSLLDDVFVKLPNLLLYENLLNVLDTEEVRSEFGLQVNRSKCWLKTADQMRTKGAVVLGSLVRSVPLPDQPWFLLRRRPRRRHGVQD